MTDPFTSTKPAEIAPFIEDCAPDDEAVIACAPEALPPGYTARRN